MVKAGGLVYVEKLMHKKHPFECISISVCELIPKHFGIKYKKILH
jgi:hypothetical protein